MGRSVVIIYGHRFITLPFIKAYVWQLLFNVRNISGVMVSMLTRSAVNLVFKPWSGQSKDYATFCIGIYCFSAKHTNYCLRLNSPVSYRHPVSNRRPILKSMSDFYVTDICSSDLCPFFKFSNRRPIFKSKRPFLTSSNRCQSRH